MGGLELLVLLLEGVESDGGRGGEGIGAGPMLGHHSLPRVLLRLPEDDVDLGSEEAGQLDQSADGEGHGERDDPDGAARRREEEGDEGHPEDAGRVSREPDVAGLVEPSRALASLEGVDRAAAQEDEGVDEPHEVGVIVHAFADEDPAVPVLIPIPS